MNKDAHREIMESDNQPGNSGDNSNQTNNSMDSDQSTNTNNKTNRTNTNNTTNTNHTPRKDHHIELLLATPQNTQNVGTLISDHPSLLPSNPSTSTTPTLQIPFYTHITEGPNFPHADWKDQPVVRLSKIQWRDDREVLWLERHMEMTQGFIFVGSNPGLMILGEPTHEREDLSEEERKVPDLTRVKGYILPGGCGMILKKGTWHDFPISVGPDLTVFVMNTREVVEALMSMREAGPMDFGDCYKIRTRDVFPGWRLMYQDPRPVVRGLGLIPEAKESLEKG